jgi:hypothetical protein
MYDPIAYMYEAALHCPDCALERFGRDADGWITGADSEGNQIGVVPPWDETDPAGEYCDTCGVQIAEPWDDHWEGENRMEGS